MGIIVWEGIPRSDADKAYDSLKETVPQFGMALEVSIYLFWAGNPLCLSSYSALLFMIDYSFLVHHLIFKLPPYTNPGGIRSHDPAPICSVSETVPLDHAAGAVHYLVSWDDRHLLARDNGL
jgi:hypothetical protein